MPLSQFLMMCLVCAFQTVLFTQALKNGQTILTLFWGLMLFRNLHRVYLVDKLARLIGDIFDKQDK